MSIFEFFSSARRKSADTSTDQTSGVPDDCDARHYTGGLQETLAYFAQTLGLSDDYLMRPFEVAGHPAACVFVATLCDRKTVENTLRTIHDHQFPNPTPEPLTQYLIEHVLPGSDCVLVTTLLELKHAVAAGDLVLMIDGVSPAIVLGAKHVESRKPESPYTERAIRGSQISFVEDVDTNVGLLRSALSTDTLLIKIFKIGVRTRTEVVVAYLGDVANPIAVNTVTERLNALHVDAITQSADIEQRIVDHKWTVFPLVRTTQRIDATVREINQGKIAIIVDSDSTVLMVPATVHDFFQTQEDYARSFYEATFVRWLRIVSLLLACYLPALYIAFVDFNPELLPKTLGLQIASSREGVPFPGVVEVLMMQVFVEILREASLRMPKQMGQTISIVGGLVLGEASVQAGIVSNILIIIIALSFISLFVTPSYEFATVLRLGSWLMFLSAAMLGLYGILLMTVFIIYELTALKSFGISYMDPFNGEHLKEMFMDGLVRLPFTLLDKRTSHLHPQDSIGERGPLNPIPHPQLENASPQRTAFRRKKP